MRETCSTYEALAFEAAFELRKEFGSSVSPWLIPPAFLTLSEHWTIRRLNTTQSPRTPIQQLQHLLEQTEDDENTHPFSLSNILNSMTPVRRSFLYIAWTTRTSSTSIILLDFLYNSFRTNIEIPCLRGGTDTATVPLSATSCLFRNHFRFGPSPALPPSSTSALSHASGFLPYRIELPQGHETNPTFRVCLYRFFEPGWLDLSRYPCGQLNGSFNALSTWRKTV